MAKLNLGDGCETSKPLPVSHTPPDVVEIVARAIHKHRQSKGFGGSASWEYEPRIIHELHKSTAQAAITALEATRTPLPASVQGLVDKLCDAIDEAAILANDEGSAVYDIEQAWLKIGRARAELAAHEGEG